MTDLKMRSSTQIDWGEVEIEETLMGRLNMGICKNN